MKIHIVMLRQPGEEVATAQGAYLTLSAALDNLGEEQWISEDRYITECELEGN